MTIEKYAKDLGYESVRSVGTWNGYDVYEPSMGMVDNIPIIGIPIFILVNGTEMRTSRPEEAFTILDALYENE